MVAARVGQEYNRRKRRRGAFWEDRYFATAVETDHHLVRCLVYIDLNMVRAGRVEHPSSWKVCGFNEIQNPRQRYRIIDFPALCQLTGTASVALLRRAHLNWVEEALLRGDRARDPAWTETVGVGSKDYVDALRARLGHKACYRLISPHGSGSFVVSEP
jgi:putative transposase